VDAGGQAHANGTAWLRVGLWIALSLCHLGSPPQKLFCSVGNCWQEGGLHGKPAKCAATASSWSCQTAAIPRSD